MNTITTGSLDVHVYAHKTLAQPWHCKCDLTKVGNPSKKLCELEVPVIL